MGFVIKMDQQGGKFHLHKVELFLHFQLKVTEETPRELLRHAFCACVYFYFYHSSNSPPCDCPRVYHGASGLSRCLGSITMPRVYLCPFLLLFVHRDIHPCCSLPHCLIHRPTCVCFYHPAHPYFMYLYSGISHDS